MNYSIIFYIIGWILNLEAAFMLPSCLVALIYQESSGWSLVAATLLSGSAGSGLCSAAAPLLSDAQHGLLRQL